MALLCCFAAFLAGFADVTAKKVTKKNKIQ